MCIGSRVCDDDEYTCGNGFCIPGIWECDDIVDCFDGSDETGCSGTESSESIHIYYLTKSYGGYTHLCVLS